MSQSQIDLIRSSFAEARPIERHMVDKFYDFLFSDYPESTPLFSHVDMPGQKRALLSSLAYIVDHLDQPEVLQNYLFKMGQRHVGYGTQPEHYDLVGATLLKTLKFFFGERWTEELEAAWTFGFQAIKAGMLEGHHSVRGPAQGQSPEAKAPIVEPPPTAQSVALRKRAEEICSALMLEVLETELSDEVIAAIRAKVRSALLDCLEEEASKLLRRVG